jgi:hypothetical protein
MRIKKLLQTKRLGPITLLHLLAIAAVTTVFGAVLLNYDWTMTLTASVPDVRFYRWSDATQSNTVDLQYNFYADVWVIDENATHGVINNAASSKTIDLWVGSCSDPTRVANYTLQILSGAGSTLCTWTTTDFSNIGESNAVSWTADANAIYTVKVMIKGASTIAGVSIQLRLGTTD